MGNVDLVFFFCNLCSLVFSFIHFGMNPMIVNVYRHTEEAWLCGTRTLPAGVTSQTTFFTLSPEDTESI